MHHSSLYAEQLLMGDESSRAIEMCARYIILYGTVCYIFFRPCPVHYDSWCEWMPPTTGGRVVIKNAVFKQGAKIASSRFSRRQQQQPKVASAGMQPVKQSRFLQLSGCCHNSISLYTFEWKLWLVCIALFVRICS